MNFNEKNGGKCFTAVVVLSFYAVNSVFISDFQAGLAGEVVTRKIGKVGSIG